MPFAHACAAAGGPRGDRAGPGERHMQSVSGDPGGRADVEATGSAAEGRAHGGVQRHVTRLLRLLQLSSPCRLVGCRDDSASLLCPECLLPRTA